MLCTFVNHPNKAKTLLLERLVRSYHSPRGLSILAKAWATNFKDGASLICDRSQGNNADWILTCAYAASIACWYPTIRKRADQVKIKGVCEGNQGPKIQRPKPKHNNMTCRISELLFDWLVVLAPGLILNIVNDSKIQKARKSKHGLRTE